MISTDTFTDTLDLDVASMSTDDKLAAFKTHVADGHTIEVNDWMPDEYRAALVKFIEMHANSEIMGALPERDWILRAPTLHRKLALTSKIQDEVGHAHLLYRIVEDLGKPREQIFDDLISGKSKFHNVFHYDTYSWGDVGIIAWLVDGAAIISQSALQRASYGPYARTMKRICWEEAFHLKHGEDIVLTAVAGSDGQKAMMQEALNRWWTPLMHFFGPPTPAEQDKLIGWHVKTKDNETLRQEFLKKYVPRILEIGLTIPDDALAHDDGRWHYTMPNWDDLYTVVKGDGPASQSRLGFRRLSYDETAWVRQTVVGDAPAAA